MSDGNNLIAMGPCWVCGNVFTFNPDTVVSVWIDPVTNQPPDTLPAEQQAAAIERAVQQPICPDSATELNEVRARSGKPPIRQARS